MIPEGVYDGEVIGAWLDEDKDKNLVMAFEVQLEGGPTCNPKQATTGKYDQIAVDLCKFFGLEWPYGLQDMDQCIGKPVRVRIKHNVSNGRTYENAYILTASGRRAESSSINRKLDDLARAHGVAVQTRPEESGDDIPF